MAEIVYPPVISTAKVMFRALGLKLTVLGGENVPASGGAVIASNHVSYLDFIFAGLGAHPRRRLVRFMAKDAVFTNKISGPLMRGMHHIPVDRSAGAGAYRLAIQALKDGEVIGVFPEATISRSFTVKDFKSGAVRLAQESGTPLIPMALWGAHRIYTKGHKRDWSRGKAVTISVGEPMYPKPGEDLTALTAELHRRIEALLDDVQRSYPQQPAGDADRWWLPVHLGGTAPTPAEAAQLDADEARARAAARKAK